MTHKVRKKTRNKSMQGSQAQSRSSVAGQLPPTGPNIEGHVEVCREFKGIPEEESGAVSRSTADKVVWPMVLVLGIILVICVCYTMQYFAVKQVSRVVESAADKPATSSISDRILFVSKHYELRSQTEDNLQYSGIDDTEGVLGLLIVDDLGTYATKESAYQRARSAMTDGSEEIPVTDTTSLIYEQHLPSYEVKTDWVCMSIYYYYDEVNRHLYSLMYSNEPYNYEGSLARATKELLSIRFE